MASTVPTAEWPTHEGAVKQSHMNSAYLTVKNHAGSGAPQRLVGGGCHDVTVLEWLLSLLSCHQPTAGSTGSSLTTLADCVQ